MLSSLAWFHFQDTDHLSTISNKQASSIVPEPCTFVRQLLSAFCWENKTCVKKRVVVGFISPSWQNMSRGTMIQRHRCASYAPHDSLGVTYPQMSLNYSVHDLSTTVYMTHNNTQYTPQTHVGLNKMSLRTRS